MKLIDAQGRKLLATGQIALAGTIMLAGPACADDRVSFREFRQANPDGDRKELRQMFRAERQELRIQNQARPNLPALSNHAPRVEYQPTDNNQFVITPVVLPTSPRLERTTFTNANGRVRSVSRGLELDLTSDNRSITLGENLFSNASSYTVNVGGEQKVLTSGSRVTAAEFIALQQVIDGDAQSLVVDKAGRGVDGAFNLGSIDNAGRNITAKSLTISEGVDVTGDFGNRADFRVTKELVNYGSITALSSNNANNKANIGARDFTNAASGTITTSPDTVAPIDLKLSADRDLSNLGSISSSGSVTLSAGGTLTNSGSVSAQTDVNLLSANVVNSGSIAAHAGNVNFDTAVASDITVNSTGGTISALSGGINFRSPGFASKNNTTLIGGDWFSQSLHVESGSGHLDLNVGDLTGLVSANTGTATIVADTQDLNLGAVNTNGDPLIAVTGNVTLNAEVPTVGGPFTVIAGGNITFNSGGSVNTDSAGDAGDILLIAGAAFTDNGATITVNGASGTGGNVSFTGTAPVITANSTTSGDGGNITIAAFEVGASTGQVSLLGATIQALGSTGNDNGTVAIYADQIQVNNIDVNGAGTTNTSGTGNIILDGSQPQITGPFVINDPNGDVVSGSIGPGVANNSSISFPGGATFDARNLVSLQATNATYNSGTIAANSVSISTIGDLQLYGDIIVSGAVSIATQGAIDLRADITAPGGILMVAGQSIDVGNGSPLLNTSAAGQAGDVTLVAGALWTDNGTTITINGSSNSPLGSSVNFSFGAVGIDARGTGLDASGGNVTLVAFAKADGSGGAVGMPTDFDILTGGTQTGDNGNIVIVAGKNDGGAGITFNRLLDTTGAQDNGTGDITLVTSAPLSGAVLSKLNGSVATGTFLGGAITNSSIFGATNLSKIRTNGGDILVRAGAINNAQGVDIDEVSAQAGAVRIDSSGAGSSMRTRIIQGGSIVVTAALDVNLFGGVGWNTQSFGGGITVVAGGTISNAGVGTDFITVDGSSSGSITLVAGANFIETAGSLTITGPSTTGGNINFGNGFDQLDTSGTGGGGAVNLIAYAGSGGGNIFLDSSTDIYTEGIAGPVANGNVLIVAGQGGTGSAIQTLGLIDTNGGLSGTGSVTVVTAQPLNGATISKTSGAVTSGQFITSTPMLTTAGINTGGSTVYDVDQGSTLTFNIGGITYFNDSTMSAGRIRIAAGDLASAGAGLGTMTSSGSTTVTSVESINIRRDIVARGGLVMVTGGRIDSVSAGNSLVTSSATGDGGEVVLISGAAFTQDLVNINITGQSNDPDAIGMGLATTWDTIDTRSTGGSGAGGNVTLVQMGTTGSFTQGITVGGGGLIQTGGNGGGVNGNVTVISGSTGGNAITMEAEIDTTGGATGTGDILMATIAPSSTSISIQKNDGTINGGSFADGGYTSAAIVQSGGQGGITTDGGNVTVNAGAAITMQFVNAGSGDVAYSGGITSAGAKIDLKGITANAISVVTTANIDMRGGDFVATGGGILFVAGTNIENNGAGMSFLTSGAGDSGDIILVAGADFSQGPNNVIVNGANGLGGAIFIGNGFGSIDARSTSGNGDGGDITLIAYSATDGSLGFIGGDNNTSEILSGGSGSGDNGDILIIGSHNQGGNAITWNGEISASGEAFGGVNGTGDVTLKSAVPGSNVTFNRQTLAQTGSFDSATVRNANVRVNNRITTNGGDTTILSGRNVQIGEIFATPDGVGDAGSIFVTSNGADTLNIGSSGNSFIGNIEFSGGIVSGNGGNLEVRELGANGLVIHGTVLQQNNNNGDGGDIYVETAGTMFFQSGPVVIEASGQGAAPFNAGSIELRANNFNFGGNNVDLRTNQSSGGGNAGTITVVSNGSLLNAFGTAAGQFDVQQSGPNSELNIASTAGSLSFNSALLADVITMQAATGITQTSGATITANELTVTIGASALADLDTATNEVAELNIVGPGSIDFNNGTTSLNLGTATGNPSMNITAGPITTTVDITTTGSMTFNTGSFTNDNDLVASEIIIAGTTDLVVDGGAGGTFNGTVNGITFTALNGDLTLQGDQTYISEAEMVVTSATGTFVVDLNADIVGQQLLLVNAENVNLIGDIIGNPLVFLNGVTIANSNGNVVLSGNIVLQGSAAILASGNVDGTGITSIDLSALSGLGGNLTVVAGYTFTPATTGQEDDAPDTFTNFTGSASGGNIDFTGVSIDTSSASGSGGSVLLVANAGTTNAGTITTGNIDASGTVDGGDVNIIASSNITVGNINNAGGTGEDNDINIVATDAFISGTPSVTRGVLSGGTWDFDLDVRNNANITVGNVTAGRGDFSVYSEGTANVTQVGTIAANDITLDAGESTLDLTAMTGITAAQDLAGNGGSIYIESGFVQLNSTATAPFTLTADATGTGDGGSVTFFTLDLVDTAIGNVPKTKATRFLDISARGGATSGDGGNVGVVIGGNLSVDTTALTAGPQAGNSDGAVYELVAGRTNPKGGSLIIIGNLDASGAGTGNDGEINLSMNSSKAFSVGGTKAPKNGIQGNLIGSEVEIENGLGGITVETTAGISATEVRLEAGGKGSIATGKGATLTSAGTLELEADQGSIGKKAMLISALNVIANTDGGSVNLQNTRAGATFLGDSSSSGSFSLTTAGGVTVGNISTVKGNVSVIANGGVLAVAAGSELTANNGAMLLQNTDITTGSIFLGANSVIETQGKGKDTTIVIGPIPKKPVEQGPPAGIIPTPEGKGKFFFSNAAGFVVNGTNAANAINKDVIVINGSTAPGTQKITFDGNVTVEADPPSRAASAVMPAMLSQTSNETGSLNTFGALSTLPASNVIGSAFNSQNVSAIPTDLLSSFSNTAGNETTLAGVTVATTGGSNSNADYGYMTNAYVWSDEDLGLESSSMLKSGSGSGTTSGISEIEIAKLRKGTIVLAPSKDTRLETPMGTVEVSKGSVALLVLDDSRLGVYDLHDAHKGSIRVINGSKSTTLSPGRCTVLTNRTQHGFERVNPMEAIGYKSVSSVHHGNGIKAFNAEFATTHAIGSVKPLMDIVGSKHENARRMSNKLMKTSAVLMHISAGEFKTYAEPSVTAMK